ELRDVGQRAERDESDPFRRFLRHGLDQVGGRLLRRAAGAVEDDGGGAAGLELPDEGLAAGGVRAGGRGGVGAAGAGPEKGRPAWARKRHTMRARSSACLPTVVTARTSSSGLARASARAKASSMSEPRSVSMMTGIFALPAGASWARQKPPAVRTLKASAARE